SVKLVLLGAPNKPTVCIAPDMKNIPSVHKIICPIANLFIFGVMIRLDKCGTSQQAITNNVTATDTPTVKWKYPVTQSVLTTTWLSLKIVCTIHLATVEMNV